MRRKALHDTIHRLVGDLEVAGRYDCCIQNPCQQCAIRMGGCACGESLRRGGPVCEECAVLWKSGMGAEAGVEPGTVRSYLEAAREEEARAKGNVPGCVCAEPKP